MNGLGRLPFADYADADPDALPFDAADDADTSCNCDLDSPCSFPPCVAEREAEEAEMFASYRRGTLGPPADVQRAMYADIMREAGRDYLLRDDER